jgi:hypothetical protein
LGNNHLFWPYKRPNERPHQKGRGRKENREAKKKQREPGLFPKEKNEKNNQGIKRGKSRNK